MEHVRNVYARLLLNFRHRHPTDHRSVLSSVSRTIRRVNYFRLILFMTFGLAITQIVRFTSSKCPRVSTHNQIDEEMLIHPLLQFLALNDSKLVLWHSFKNGSPNDSSGNSLNANAATGIQLTAGRIDDALSFYLNSSYYQLDIQA